MFTTSGDADCHVNHDDADDDNDHILDDDDSDVDDDVEVGFL